MSRLFERALVPVVAIAALGMGLALPATALLSDLLLLAFSGALMVSLARRSEHPLRLLLHRARRRSGRLVVHLPRYRLPGPGRAPHSEDTGR